MHVAIKALWGLQRHHPHRVRPNPSWKLALTLHFDHPEWGCYHCILGVVFCLAQLLSYVVSPPFINYIYIYIYVCVCLPHITTLFGVSLRLFHTQFFWLLHMHHTIIATVPATSEVSFLHISKKYITHIIKLLHSWFNNSSQSGFVPHTSTFATLNEHMSIVRLVKRTVPWTPHIPFVKPNWGQ
jgi:hypothetical protein